jgi:hypothetical protein
MNKVSSGDPLEIPPDTWNTMLDAARDFQNRRQDQQAGRGHPGGSSVPVYISSGAPCACMSPSAPAGA